MKHLEEHSEYVIVELVLSDSLYAGYHAKKKSNKENCFIRTLAADLPSNIQINSIKNDYHLGCQFKHKNILKYHSLEKYRQGFLIVHEDTTGFVPISNFPHRLSIKQFLNVVIQLMAAIDDIHKKIFC